MGVTSGAFTLGSGPGRFEAQPVLLAAPAAGGEQPAEDLAERFGAGRFGGGALAAVEHPVLPAGVEPATAGL